MSTDDLFKISVPGVRGIITFDIDAGWCGKEQSSAFEYFCVPKPKDFYTFSIKFFCSSILFL